MEDPTFYGKKWTKVSQEEIGSRLGTILQEEWESGKLNITRSEYIYSKEVSWSIGISINGVNMGASWKDGQAPPKLPEGYDV